MTTSSNVPRHLVEETDAGRPSEGEVEVITQGQGTKSPNGKSNVLRELVLLLIKIAAIVLIGLLLFSFMFGVFRNVDISMSPSIKDGDLVLFYRLDKEYVKDDVIVLKYEGDEQTRRVVAVAGDSVDISKDGLIINGARQAERGIYEKTERYDTGVEFPLTVQEGQVFVLGDGRENATDSRVYGCVDTEDTLGQVMTIIRRRGI